MGPGRASYALDVECTCPEQYHLHPASPLNLRDFSSQIGSGGRRVCFCSSPQSQFWFVGFATTTAANVGTLGLVEVLFAAVVSRRIFAQAISSKRSQLIPGLVLEGGRGLAS